MGIYTTFVCLSKEGPHSPKRSDGYLQRLALSQHRYDNATKGIPLAIYEGFVCLQRQQTGPKKPSDRYFLGFSSKRPKPRTPRTPPAGAKNSVRGRFAAEGHQKRPTLERLERSGEFKGVKGTEGVFEGGAGPRAESGRTQLQHGLGPAWEQTSATKHSPLPPHTNLASPCPLNRGYGGIHVGSMEKKQHLIVTFPISVKASFESFVTALFTSQLVRS